MSDNDLRTDGEHSLKAFVKPDVHVLDVKGTETGPFPDPFEFPTILQAS